MSISTLTTVAPRELARRVNGGLEITLYWHPDDNATSVEVYHQATGETTAFPVPGDRRSTRSTTPSRTLRKMTPQH